MAAMWRRYASAVLAIFVMLAGAAPRARAGTNTFASRELGQPNFQWHNANTVDPETMYRPGAVAIDRGLSPNRAYVVDSTNNRVLVFSSVAALVSGAAATTVLGQPNAYTGTCNTGGVNAAALCNPSAAVVDANGNLYIADGSNNRVLVYSRSAAASNNGSAFMVLGQGGDFTSNACNLGGTAPNAETMCLPSGLALDTAGNLYVADSNNHRVIEFNTPLTKTATPGSGDATADLEFGQGAGSGVDFTHNVCNSGGISATSLCTPYDVTVDPSGNVYIADYGNSRVLEYNTPLTAGTTADNVFGQSNSFGGSSCNLGGIGPASLCSPVGVMADSAGNLYVADYSNNRVLEYNTPLTTDLIADRVFGQNDDLHSNACNFGAQVPDALSACGPMRMAYDGAGNLYLADGSNNRVLEFNTPLATDTTADLVLGQPDFFHNSTNSVDATGFWSPTNVAIDTSVSPNRLYVSDFNNNRVLVFANAQAFANNAPAIGVIGQPDLFSSTCNNSGVSQSSLCEPVGVAVDPSGNVYVADQANNRILEYNTPFANTGAGSNDFIADNVFGQGGDFTSNSCNVSGSPDADSLCTPYGIALDNHQNLWVADRGNSRVLMYISPMLNTTANLVVGQPDFVSGTCNNAGVSAHSLCQPYGVALDASRNLYVSDSINNRVLEFTAPATSNPNAASVFGQLGSFASNGCNNGGVSADALCFPAGIALDLHNNLYVADSNNSRTLEYNTPLTTDTHADRVYGQADNFTSGSCNLGGTLASSISECLPDGVVVDGSFNVYVADSTNNRVVQYDPPEFVPAVISFGRVALHRSVRKKLQLVNTQGVWLQNLMLTLSGSGDFKIKSTTCGNTLAPQSSCQVVVRFRPTSRGAQSATLNASDDAINSPQTAQAAGIGGRKHHH